MVSIGFTPVKPFTKTVRFGNEPPARPAQNLPPETFVEGQPGKSQPAEETRPALPEHIRKMEQARTEAEARRGLWDRVRGRFNK